MQATEHSRVRSATLRDDRSRSMKRFALTVAVVANAVVALGCGGGERATVRPTNDGASSRDAGPVDPEDTNAAAQLLAAQLEEAYRANSDDQLVAFFRRWHDSVRPVDMDEVTARAEREIYAVYLAFFRPFSLDEIAGQFIQDSDQRHDPTP
jgi:hypothetical protein